MGTWSDAFAKHIESLGLTQQQAFISLNRAHVPATQSQVSYWCRGAAYPREETRKKIERWSKGAVPADLPASVTVPRAS